MFFFFFPLKLSMYNKTRNRGLAFVEMGSPEEALAALKNLESYVSLLLHISLIFSFHKFFLFIYLFV